MEQYSRPNLFLQSTQELCDQKYVIKGWVVQQDSMGQFFKPALILLEPVVTTEFSILELA